MDEGRKERLARNEAAFRKVNEAIGGRNDPGVAAGRGAYLCECGALGCNQLVELTREQYESVRAYSSRFFVLPGHEEPAVEDVVDRLDDYYVVQKHEPEAEIAETTDPRGD